MRVYHLVGHKHGLENLRLRRLKIAEIDKLNDPFELRSFSSKDQEIRDALETTRSELAKKTGILCFSKNWNNPVLWSHYAEQHRGMALGFDVEDCYIKEVTYLGTRKFFDSRILSEDLTLAEEQILGWLTTKYSHWKYENEWCLFARLEEPDASSKLYFAPFSDKLRLREVILGVRSTVSKSEIFNALGDLSTDVVSQKARLAFGSYRVVKQRNLTLWE